MIYPNSSSVLFCFETNRLNAAYRALTSQQQQREEKPFKRTQQEYLAMAIYTALDTDTDTDTSV